MADPQIFPGFQEVGRIPEVLRSALVVYTAGALQVLQSVPDNIVRFADIAGVTAGEWTAKIPIDITALDGFEEDTGKDINYKKMDLIAIDVAAVPFVRAAEWEGALARANLPLTNINNMGGNMIAQARKQKARVVAAVLKGGRPGGVALTYEQIGAPNGLSLWNTAHYVNPKEARFGTFSNYFAGAGKFSITTMEDTRTNMRMVKSPTGDQETLGLELTRIIGPSHMEETFRNVMLQTLALQVADVGGTKVAGATTNIQVAGTSPWKYDIAPALDNDPYLVAFRAAFVIANNRQPTPRELPHLWIAISESIPGAHVVEMIAPSTSMAPIISVLGLGSEHQIKTDKVAIIARMKLGAAAGLPHVGARYEET